MKELLNYILSQIVKDPLDIKIDIVEEVEETKLNVTIPKEDRAIVIGKSGMNIKAIRNLVSIIARRENKKVYIKILD